MWRIHEFIKSGIAPRGFMGRRSRGTNVRSAFTVFFLNLCLVSDVTTLEAASSFATRKRSTFSHAHHEGKKKIVNTSKWKGLSSASTIYALSYVLALLYRCRQK